MKITDPLSINRKEGEIKSVLRNLASQESCDGEPYDQMILAADYIEYLESIIKAR